MKPFAACEMSAMWFIKGHHKQGALVNLIIRQLKKTKKRKRF